MSFAGTVLGRREPNRARADLVCGITTARLTFESEFELDVRAAAITFDPSYTSAATHFGRRLDELLRSIVEDTGAILAGEDDGFGLRWIKLSGASLDDLAISISLAAEAFELAGRWEQLVCAVFAFERKRRCSGPRVYWIYNFVRGTFYAFVPRGYGRRDSEEELRLHARTAHDLRLERDAQRCHPLWDIPL